MTHLLGVSAATIGLVGVALGGFIGSVTSIVIARLTNQHQKVLAEDERTQRRREDTYQSVMSYAIWAAQHAYAEFEKWSGLDPERQVPPPPEETGRDLLPPIMTYGTKEAVAKLGALTHSVANFDGLALEAARQGKDVQLDQAMMKVQRDSDALRDQIREDLGVEPLPRASSG
jgi:hypothetical protein